MTVASLVLGDFNMSLAEVEALARRCGGTAVRGHGPDHAIVIGAKVVDVHVLGKFGSDAHHAILFELDVDGVLMTALLWNVWVGQRPRRVLRTLRSLIRKHHPDVIVLNEAYRCGEVLAKVRGFDVQQGPNVGEGADVGVLVAARHRVAHSRVLRMRERWLVASHNKIHAGREFRAVRAHLASRRALRVLGIHFATDNAHNEDARRESEDRVVRWATKRKKAHR